MAQCRQGEDEGDEHDPVLEADRDAAQLGEGVVRRPAVRDGDEGEERGRQWAQARLPRQPSGGDGAQQDAQEAGWEGERQDRRGQQAGGPGEHGRILVTESEGALDDATDPSLGRRVLGPCSSDAGRDHHTSDADVDPVCHRTARPRLAGVIFA